MEKKISDSADRIRELMEKKGLTQQQISEDTGIGRSSLSHYINRFSVPHQDALSKLCDAYNLEPAWLMGYDVPMYRKRDVGFDFYANLSEKDEALVIEVVHADDKTKEMIVRMLAYAKAFNETNGEEGK